MVVGDYNPPLHPDKPTLLTFYMGLYTPGHTAYQQGVLGRMRLLSTSYVEYEWTIRRQMDEMLSGVGFDAKRDIAGIVLNRWGHARVIQPPGFYYGVNGKPMRDCGKGLWAHHYCSLRTQRCSKLHGCFSARETSRWRGAVATVKRFSMSLRRERATILKLIKQYRGTTWEYLLQLYFSY